MSGAPAGAGAMPPRPLSSYALALVGGAALAITGALTPLALALHALALVAGLRLRRRPRAWQRSGLVLNTALGAVLVYTATLWLQGMLALVALAHFAHLGQALQLLDARPRRSDFLLVALSLFQMLLAANLTDSLLFPPLLLVFALAMSWTLIVHTLWSESLAAAAPWSSEAALAPGFARTSVAAALLSLVLALGIFLVLPRVRSGALAAPGLAAVPQAGFSDRVALGDLGRIRGDPTVVMRIETLRGVAPARRDAYWRGLAFDHFDGRTWSVTPPARRLISRAPDLGIGLARGLEGDLEQRVLREPVASGVLFVEGTPLVLAGSVGTVERDLNGGLYAPESANDRIVYRTTSASRRPGLAALRADHTVPPARGGDRYLALPPLAPEVAALAREITAGAATDADRVAAVERHLREHGRYADAPPPERPGDRSPIEGFLLGETEGHCEYFATAMVVLLRSIGIPARLVNGFAGGETNEIGGFVEVSRSDAHAWVEVHYAEAGWVRYDPTPPDLRLARAATPWLAQLRNLGSAIEHWWFQHVVEFDRSDQMRAMREGWLAWRRWRHAARRAAEPASAGESAPALPWGRLVPTGAALVALSGAGFALARRWRRPARRRPRLPPAYAEALRLLGRHRGLVREPALPAREFARRAAHAIPPAAAAAFWTLTEDYLAERFGGRRSGTSRAALRTLRDTLRRR